MTRFIWKHNEEWWGGEKYKQSQIFRSRQKNSNMTTNYNSYNIHHGDVREESGWWSVSISCRLTKINVTPMVLQESEPNSYLIWTISKHIYFSLWGKQYVVRPNLNFFRVLAHYGDVWIVSHCWYLILKDLSLIFVTARILLT